ncbi:uncharacterized protein LOC142101757 isoform X2 [Mixophyes fleayi]|uniref:uncharacterized protein LOC142101757 isoform X2 n=1 Tax=Mixophyes fleayi TaxID=3061075 RepID=UPI003F4E212E
MIKRRERGTVQRRGHSTQYGGVRVTQGYRDRTKATEERERRQLVGWIGNIPYKDAKVAEGTLHCKKIPTDEAGKDFTDMKSPHPETGPTNPEEEGKHSEPETQPSGKHQKRSEKDSGYSGSSSESISSEEIPPLPTASEPDNTQSAPQAQTAYTTIYILQNVVLKQPQIVLQTPACCHRKRTSPASYLPILRSYPRIAPRLDPPSTSQNATAISPAAPVCTPASPNLLELSLRSLALLRRTQETERSIRQLKAHAILYERALHGEEGGWERLHRAMESSGSYGNIPPLTGTDGNSQAEEPASIAVTSLHGSVTSSPSDVTSLDGSDPSLDGSNPSLDGSDPSLDGSDPSLDGSDPSLDGSDTSLDGSDTSLDGTTVLSDDFIPSPGNADTQEEAMTFSGKSMKSPEAIISAGGKVSTL